MALELTNRADLELIMDAYSEWVLDDVYLTFEHERVAKTVQTGATETVRSYRVLKGRKRGNDVDAHLLDRKMRVLRDNVAEFVPSGLRSTQVLYVTGTVDPARVGHDPERAWRDFSKWFNSFVTSVRQKCVTVEVGADGRVQECRARVHVLRSYEAHKSGMPHFHALLCFEGYSWEMFQDRRMTWRVRRKDVIESSWTHGFVDVRAVTRGTLDKNVQNVLWYVTKNLADMDYRQVWGWDYKRRLTIALLWYLGKRAFSVSRALLVDDTHPAADDLTKPYCITQMDLEGNQAVLESETWIFIGLVHRTDTDLARDDWEKEFSEPPDWLNRCWKPHSGHGGLGWTNTWGS